jgi:hypothetical protein
MGNPIEDGLLGGGGIVGGLLLGKLLGKLTEKGKKKKKDGEEEKIVDEANKDLENAEESEEGHPKGLTLETISIGGHPKGLFGDDDDEDEDGDDYKNELMKTLKKLTSKQSKAAGRL